MAKGGIRLLLALLVATSTVVGATNVTSGYDATYDSNKVTCVFPISGQYGFLTRVLYYVLIFFAALSQAYRWVVAAALASVMTYSGGAAVHAIVIYVVSKHSQPNLDMYAIWNILSAGLLAIIPFMWLSTTLRESQGRPIFGFWVVLLIIGCGFSAATIFKGSYPIEDECRSASGELLSSALDQLRPGFSCTYESFSADQATRSSTELLAVPASRLWGVYFTRFQIAATAITFALVAAWSYFTFRGSPRRRTRDELLQAIRENGDMLSQRGTASKYRSRHEWNKTYAEEELRTGEFPLATITRFFGVLSTGVTVMVIAFNEYFLRHGAQLPESEPLTAVGQWSRWVVVALVIIGAAINSAYEPGWKRRQETLRKEKKGFETSSVYIYPSSSAV